MASNPAYVKDEEEDRNNWTRIEIQEKVHSYSDAIDLAGHGWYNIGLLVTLSLALTAMTGDMFNFPLLLTVASCDLQITGYARNISVLMPLLGPIIMAFFWGYLSDTRGRRSTLMIALALSFLFSFLGVFSPHWIVLAVSRFFSTCFCSCAQSCTYTLLGESCPDRIKDVYILVMSSSIFLVQMFSFLLAYAVSSLTFSYDIGLINFTPWRFLGLLMALPIGLSAFLLLFFKESPKFLLNVGKENDAIDALKAIYARNCGNKICYPVKKVVLTETGNLKAETQKQPLLKSMWLQTVPLFRPPLLVKTMMLFYIIFALYSVTTSIFIWLPYLAKFFSEGILSSNDKAQGLCAVISVPYTNSTTIVESCTTTIGLPVAIAMTAAGAIYCVLSIFVSKWASYKRLIMITVFFISFISCIGGIVIPNNIISIIMYLCIVASSLNMGVVFSYCVELYPTSFRGMASCLGVLVARLSGIIGISLTGPYIRTYCEATFSACAVLMLSATVMSYFLPKDNPGKKVRK